MGPETATEKIFATKDTKTNEDSVEAKDFFWDQFVRYLGSAILSLVVLEVSVDFLRGEGVSCFHPADTFSVLHPNILTADEVYRFGSGQAEFLNSFCENSIPATEYFPLFNIVHGLLIILPHYIWKSIHKGDFDSFFSIAGKMERLRKSKTGEYSEENFDRVSKLEKQYGGKRNTIFLTYILKLVVQLSVCVISIGFSGGYFTEFSFSFECPRSLVETGQAPDGWPLNGTVSCVYTSLRILRLVRVADFILTALAGSVTIYGFMWCIFRHTEELGHIQVANFVFQSYLKPEDFEFPPVLRFGKQKPLRLLLTEFEVKSSMKYLGWLCAYKIIFKLGSCFSPGVRCDLDFLVLTLFRADSNYGMVFKNVQVTMELQRILGRDHQLLHLYIMIQNDIRRFNIQENSGATPLNGSGSPNHLEEKDQLIYQSEKLRPKSSKWVRNRAVCLYYFCFCCFRRKQRKKTTATSNESSAMSHRIMDDYRDLFQFEDDPEKSTYTNFKSHLGNIQLLHQGDEAGMRKTVYWFVKKFGRPRDQSHGDTISNDLALDIAFGSFGYFLVLARAFKSVFCIKFHPYYRNHEEVVKEDEFYTNYTIITYPDNLYATKQTNINMANKLINDHLNHEKRRNRKVDMIVIGPIRDEHHKVSVNILLSTVKEHINFKALLLVVRPIRIGKRKCSFFKYEPPKRFFEQYNIWSRLNDEELRKLYYVDGEPCFKLICSGVSCIFEFHAYYYIRSADSSFGGRKRQARLTI